MKKLVLLVLMLSLCSTMFAQDWEMLKQGPIEYDPYSGPNAGFFIDANTGWLVNDDGEIQKSTDGGLIWTIVREADNIGDLKDVQFANENIGLSGNYRLTAKYKFAEVYFDLGGAYQLLRKYRKAYRAYNKVIKLAPETLLAVNAGKEIKTLKRQKKLY